MKLYYTPGACSLSPHIVARESGTEIALERVEGKTKKTESGKDFLDVNPKGYVPALELDDGQVLTEGTAIVQYLADRRPEAGLVPSAGTIERSRVQEMLGYINSEIHKTYTPLFSDKTAPEVRQEREAYLRRRYAFIEKALGGNAFLVGDRFGVADAYLFAVTNWANHLKVDLSAFPNVRAFQERIAGRPAVQQAMRAEGLIP
jgi:glutathione S-transferase